MFEPLVLVGVDVAKAAVEVGIHRLTIIIAGRMSLLKRQALSI